MSGLKTEIDKLKQESDITPNFGAQSPNKNNQPPLHFTPSAKLPADAPMAQLKLAVQRNGDSTLEGMFRDFTQACKRVDFSSDHNAAMQRFNNEIVSPLKTFIRSTELDPTGELHLDAKVELKNYFKLDNLVQLQAAIARIFVWKLSKIGSDSVKSFISTIDKEFFAQMFTENSSDVSTQEVSHFVFDFYGVIISPDTMSSIKKLFKQIAKLSRESENKEKWSTVVQLFQQNLVGSTATADFIDLSKEPQTPNTSSEISSPFSPLFADTPQPAFSPLVFETPLSKAASAAQNDSLAIEDSGQKVVEDSPMTKFMRYAEQLGKNDFLFYVEDMEDNRRFCSFKADQVASGPAKFDKLLDILHETLSQGPVNKWLQVIEQARECKQYISNYSSVQMNVAQFILRELKRKFDGSVTADVVTQISAMYEGIKGKKNNMMMDDLSSIVFKLAEAIFTPGLDATKQKIMYLEVFESLPDLLDEDYATWEPLAKTYTGIISDEKTRDHLMGLIERNKPADSVEATSDKEEVATPANVTPAQTAALVLTPEELKTASTTPLPKGSSSEEELADEDASQAVLSPLEPTADPSGASLSPAVVDREPKLKEEEPDSTDSGDSVDEPVDFKKLHGKYLADKSPTKKNNILRDLLIASEDQDSVQTKFDVACDVLVDIATRYREGNTDQVGQINFIALALYQKSASVTTPADAQSIYDFAHWFAGQAFIYPTSDWVSAFDNYERNGNGIAQYLQQNESVWGVVSAQIAKVSVAEGGELTQFDNGIQALVIQGLNLKLTAPERLLVAKEINSLLANRVATQRGDSDIQTIATTIYQCEDSNGVDPVNVGYIYDFTQWLVANYVVDQFVDISDALEHYSVNGHSLSDYVQDFPDFWSDIVRQAAGLIASDADRQLFLGRLCSNVDDFETINLGDDEPDVPQFRTLRSGVQGKQEQEPLLGRQKANGGAASLQTGQTVFGTDDDVEAMYRKLTVATGLFSQDKTDWKNTLNAIKSTYYKTKGTKEARVASVVVKDMETLANFKRVVDKDPAMDEAGQKAATEAFVELHKEYTASKSKAWNAVGKTMLPLGCLAILAGVVFACMLIPAFGAAVGALAAIAVELALGVGVGGGALTAFGIFAVAKTTPNKAGRKIGKVKDANKALITPPAQPVVEEVSMVPTAG